MQAIIITSQNYQTANQFQVVKHESLVFSIHPSALEIYLPIVFNGRVGLVSNTSLIPLPPSLCAEGREGNTWGNNGVNTQMMIDTIPTFPLISVCRNILILASFHEFFESD